MVRRHGDAHHSEERTSAAGGRGLRELPIGGFLAIVVVYLAIIKGTPTAAPSSRVAALRATPPNPPPACARSPSKRSRPRVCQVSAWEVRTAPSERRVFLINKGATETTVNLQTPPALAAIDRLTPYDATGAGRILDAPRCESTAKRSRPTEPSRPRTRRATILDGQLPVAIAPGKPSASRCTTTPKPCGPKSLRPVPAALSLSLGATATFGACAPESMAATTPGRRRR